MRRLRQKQYRLEAFMDKRCDGRHCSFQRMAGLAFLADRLASLRLVVTSAADGLDSRVGRLREKFRSAREISAVARTSGGRVAFSWPPCAFVDSKRTASYVLDRAATVLDCTPPEWPRERMGAVCRMLEN